jgi:chloramphenicol 3-O phosphotransferase
MKYYDESKRGYIIILNGAPRSGKSCIAAEIQNTFAGVWINLGVDRYKPMIPDRYQPGIGLRPGGERPEFEPVILNLYKAMYESIAAHSRLGINVVADVGHHDIYSTKMQIFPQCAKMLVDYPVLVVGVRCPIEEIMRRREETSYLSYAEDGSIPAPILMWQEAVHTPGIYDLEVDTSAYSPAEIAGQIRENMEDQYFRAINLLAELV